MWFFFALLMCLATVDARVTFAKSEVLDNADLKGANAVASFRCSGGCRVYSPTQTDTIAIFDGTTQKKSLRDLANDNKGFELPGGTYKLKNTGLADQPFVFYAVEKGAVNYGLPVFYRTTTEPFILETTKTGPVTILSNTGAVTFSVFSGFESGYLPSVYAAGFDSTGSCRAVYTASSLATLAHSTISVHSPIATVDIKKGAANQFVSVSGADSQYTLAQDASAVYVSPGYVGCPAIPSVGDSLYTLLPKVASIDQYTQTTYSKGLSVAVNGDYNIANQADGISLTVNNDIKQLYGKKSISETYSDTTFNIKFSWTKKNDKDAFAIQIDIESKQGDGPAPVKTTTPGKSDVTTSTCATPFALLTSIMVSIFLSGR